MTHPEMHIDKFNVRNGSQSHSLASRINCYQLGKKDGSANGIRTRVTAVRGRCPRPLDDSASELLIHRETGRVERSACHFRMVYEPEQAILITSHFCFRSYSAARRIAGVFIFKACSAR